MNSAVLALGAALFATLGISSAAQAATIDFSVGVLDGAPTYAGASLEASTALDLDGSLLLVSSVGPDDASGLAPFDEVSISADTSPPSSNIIYGFGSGPSPLLAEVTLSWTSGADTFTETLDSRVSVNRTMPDAISMVLSGVINDTAGVFVDAPVTLILGASQVGGPGNSLSASFTTTTIAGGVPEASTWSMMALGFMALGSFAAYKRKADKATRLA